MNDLTINKHDKVTALVKRAPVKYRAAVIKVFRQLMDKFKEDENELADLENVLEDMVTHSEKAMEDIDHYKSKLQHIRYGETKGTRKDNVELFELIESFVWRYASEKIAELDLLNAVFLLGESFNTFIAARTISTTKLQPDLDIGKKLDYVKTDDITTIKLLSLEQGSIYRLCIEDNEAKDKHESLKAESSNPDLVNQFYIAIKNTQSKDYQIALLFSDTNLKNICIGLYFPGSNLFFFNFLRKRLPVFVDFDRSRLFSDDIYFYSNADITPWGISTRTLSTDEDDEFWGFKNISPVIDKDEKQYATSRAKSIFESLRYS